VAWCSPSRNSFLSGRRPDRTRIWTTLGTAPGKGFRAAPGAASWLTLTGYFKRYGYTVTAAGKCFHPDEPANNDPQSWTEPDEWKYSFGGYTTCDGVALSRSGPSWCAVLDNETAADTLIATAMAQRLVRLADAGGRNGSQPFFAMTGFLKPHLPYAYPARYDALYPGDPTHFPLPGLAGRRMPVGSPRIAWYDYFTSLGGCTGPGCAPSERAPVVNLTCRNASTAPPHCDPGNMSDTFPVAQLALLSRA